MNSENSSSTRPTQSLARNETVPLLRFLIAMMLLSFAGGSAGAGPDPAAVKAQKYGKPALSAAASAAAAASAVQSQVLETTRKTAESAIEITRKAAESAIEQTRKSTEQAIQSADRSNQMLQTVFGWAVTLLGAVLGLGSAALGFGAWVGWKEIRDVRSTFDSRLEKALEAALAGAHGRLQQVTTMSIDIAQVMDDIPKIPGHKDKQGFAKSTLADLDELEAQARGLGHSRTIGWLLTQRALIFYHLEEYETALKWQRQACDKELNPMSWPDRELNLACIAAKIYAREKGRTDMLALASETIRKVCVAAPAQAEAALADDDLKPIFEADPELKRVLQSATKK